MSDTEAILALADEISAGLTHQISEDGLVLTSTLKFRGGSASITLNWGTLDEAVKHYDRAKMINEQRLLRKYLPKLLTERDGHEEATKIRTLAKTRWGKFYLMIDAGPPTWWYPRVSIKRDHDPDGLRLRCGWIRRAYQLVWMKNERNPLP